MTSYVAAELRRIVAERACGICEYCLVHEDDTYFGCQIEHVIAEKHGGKTTADNLACACAVCNRAKGSDIGSRSAVTGQFIRFFNPRADRWSEHFEIQGAMIVPCTPIGGVTAAILQFNIPERLAERRRLVRIGRYPVEEAVRIAQLDVE
jgi:hypothetical protein